MKFLARFQRLERSRAPRTAPPRSTTSERFEALERAAPLPETHSGSLERFAPPVGPPLELAPHSDAQPFVRCPACRVDSAAGARRCQCGTPLDTPEVEAFNAELWARHRTERALQEEREERAREEEVALARERHAERQELGIAIAREIALRERARQSGLPTGFAGAMMLLGVVAFVLLPRGPVARILFASLLAAVAVRAVVAWVRSRPLPAEPPDGSRRQR